MNKNFYESRTTTDGNNIGTFFCSLNFLLCVLGYPLVMALLAPLGGNIEAGENVYFTYPYRIFQMLIAGVALFSVRNNPLPAFSWKFRLLIVFWILFFIRAYWSLFVDIPLSARGNIWYYRLYIVVDTFPLLAIVKGWNRIDFGKVLRWGLVFGFVGLIFSAQNISAQVESSWSGEIGRAAATKMLHTQALGNFGASLILLGAYMFFVKEQKKMLWKIFSAVTVFLATYIMLKAGSRGPLLAVAFAGTLWFGIRRRNIALVILLWGIAVIFLLLFYDQLISIIKEISPTMAGRVSSTTESGDTSGRDVLWNECWQESLRNPFFGYSFTAFGYPHNMFLDGLMMFGMIAGWIISVLIFVSLFSALKYLHSAQTHYWWTLLLLGSLSQSFTQSGFHSPSIQAPLLLLFIYEAQRKNATLPPMPPRSSSRQKLESPFPL